MADSYEDRARKLLAVYPHDLGKLGDIRAVAKGLREVAIETWLEAAKDKCWMCGRSYPVELDEYPTGSPHSAWVHVVEASDFNRMCRAQEHHEKIAELKKAVGLGE